MLFRRKENKRNKKKEKIEKQLARLGWTKEKESPYGFKYNIFDSNRKESKTVIVDYKMSGKHEIVTYVTKGGITKEAGLRPEEMLLFVKLFKEVVKY